jgi:hypothetical protein
MKIFAIHHPLTDSGIVKFVPIGRRPSTRAAERESR